MKDNEIYDEYLERESLYNCDNGCSIYHGGERRHLETCQFYKDSFTEMFDKLNEEHNMMKNCQNCKLKTTPLGQNCSRPNEEVSCWRKPMCSPQMNSKDFWEIGI